MGWGVQLSYERMKLSTNADDCSSILFQRPRTPALFRQSSLWLSEVSFTYSHNARADPTAPLHIDLTTSPDLPIDQLTLTRLKQANSDFDSWERYWDRILCAFAAGL
jgi:hypothetical protein